MRSFALLLMLIPATASAVPNVLTHQGRLFNSTGTPLDGSHDLQLLLYDTTAGGTALWSESFTGLTFDDGFYSVQFGDTSGNELDIDAIDIGEVYLTMSVDGGPEFPIRHRLASVPYALIADRADTATNVSGGVVDASEIRIDGTTVLDGSGLTADVAWGDVQGVPDVLTTLPVCGAGQLLVGNGLTFDCADGYAHSHDASEITSGTLDIARLPVGTTTGLVAAGDHVHTTLGDLTTGDLTAASISATGLITDSVDTTGLTVGTGGAAVDGDITVTNGVVSAPTVVTTDASARAAGEMVFRGQIPIYTGGPGTVTGNDADGLQGIAHTGLCTNCYPQVAPLPNSTRHYRFVINYSDDLYDCGNGTSTNTQWYLARHDDSSTVYTQWSMPRTWSGNNLWHTRASDFFDASALSNCDAGWSGGTCRLFVEMNTPCDRTLSYNGIWLEYYDEVL